MEQTPMTPELRKRMNRAGLLFFLLALILVGFLTHNFTRQYDPAVRAEQKQQQQRDAATKSVKP